MDLDDWVRSIRAVEPRATITFEQRGAELVAGVVGRPELGTHRVSVAEATGTPSTPLPARAPVVSVIQRSRRDLVADDEDKAVTTTARRVQLVGGGLAGVVLVVVAVLALVWWVRRSGT